MNIVRQPRTIAVSGANAREQTRAAECGLPAPQDPRDLKQDTLLRKDIPEQRILLRRVA